MTRKLDLEKVYDRLKWSFVWDTVMHICLPQIMVEVMMLCISLYSMRILWNGEPTERFYPTRL